MTADPDPTPEPTVRASSAPVTVRPAVPGDAAAVARVAAATFPDACPPTTTREAMDEHIAAQLNADVIGGWIASADHAVAVAEDTAGRVVGYVMTELAPAAEPAVAAVVGDAPVGCLSKLYVLAEARGTGVAGALMAAGLDAMRARGLAYGWLGTNVHNHRANAFYERIGFRIVGERTFRVAGHAETDFTRLIAL